jgi:hypothetical protein
MSSAVKQMKVVSLSALILSAGAALAAPHAPPGHIGGSTRLTALLAADTLQVPDIRLSGMRPVGRTVSIFYVSARPTLSTTGSVPTVHAIRLGPVKALLDTAGRATIPHTTIQQNNHWRPVNYIIVAVHRADQQDVYIRNVNGTIPFNDTRLGPHMGDDEHSILPSLDYVRQDEIGAEHMYSITLPHFQKLIQDQKVKNPVQTWVDLKREDLD